MFDLQGNYWVPWAVAGVLIAVMVIFKGYMWHKEKRRNKK